MAWRLLAVLLVLTGPPGPHPSSSRVTMARSRPQCAGCRLHAPYAWASATKTVISTGSASSLGRCITDADCAIFPPVCQHCELGGCEGFPTINPDGSISIVICPIPH